MQVKNMKMYHFHRPSGDEIDLQWVVGNTIDTKMMEYNRFCEYAFNNDGYMYSGDKKIKFVDFLKKFKDKEMISSSQYDNLLNLVYRFMRENDLLVRELILEEVRKAEYPSFPSRKHCIWLCKKEQLAYWIQNLKVQKYQSCLFEVEVSGNLFHTSSELLPEDYTSYFQKYEDARKYWSYQGKVQPDSEFLLEGICKIKRMIKEINIDEKGKVRIK